MVAALRAGTYLVAIVLAISVLLLLTGLAMAARPEIFATLGLHDTAKVGMALALVGGIGAVASAILSRVLDLVRASMGGPNGSI